ncbi:hypothetical protein EXIGLDRAFT_774928 [Exidia glandulosa HHB12029]|uniref:Uncharacterized protein n=1 Tax=Exidia glandulosa HHB12029 TaxID=1314781 RepID=A0A165E5A2_EXIGL|nr:hypothetical protein EXIGLDRAFT_774928 [Exidia glandulosa HHB12029]
MPFKSASVSLARKLKVAALRRVAAIHVPLLPSRRPKFTVNVVAPSARAMVPGPRPPRTSENSDPDTLVIFRGSFALRSTDSVDTVTLEPSRPLFDEVVVPIDEKPLDLVVEERGDGSLTRQIDAMLVDVPDVGILLMQYGGQVSRARRGANRRKAAATA